MRPEDINYFAFLAVTLVPGMIVLVVATYDGARKLWRRLRKLWRLLDTLD